jgi:hypothetical protein
MTTPGSDVVLIHPLTDDEALRWLRDRGTVETSIADLARAWGWSRPSTYRRLDRWAEEGRITKAGAAGGRWALSAVADNADSKPHQGLVADPPGGVRPAVRVGIRPVRNGPDRAVFLPAMLMVTALGLGATGLIINARFAASFGQTPDAAVLLAAIGVGLDVLAMTLPAAAAQLWNRGGRLFALVAWALWPAVLVMTLVAATGFVAGNLGDGIAGRARTAETAADLRQDLERLRQERAGIADQRSVAEIEAAIARVRIPDWARGCVVVDSAESRRACTAVLALRQAKATAQRRDTLDAEARDIESKLAWLPAVGAADPTSFAAELVVWVTAGAVAPSARDIYRTRILGLVVAPSLAGIVLMLALAVSARQRSTNHSKRETDD